jgi:hypothetical protein
MAVKWGREKLESRNEQAQFIISFDLKQTKRHKVTVGNKGGMRATS